MKVTSLLKGWLSREKGVKPDATEPEFRKAAALAIADGSLSDEKYLEFTTDSDGQNGNALKGTLDETLATLKAVNSRLDLLEGRKGSGLASGAPSLDGLVAHGEAGVLEKALGGGFGAGLNDGSDPHAGTNVKCVSKMYDTSKKELRFPSEFAPEKRHHLAGQRVFEGGDKGRRNIDELSQLEMAISGAYVKLSIAGSGARNIPRQLRFTDHDKSLIQYALEHCNWGGVVHGEGSEDNGAIGLGNAAGGQKLTPFLQKAILDDATSGGLEAAPIFFDDMMITIPLLHGEFFPKVNVVPITRGRRIEGASIGTVTLGASTEGTAISLFNTANFIAAFDTTIFVCAGAIELGLDFLSDSPLDIAGAVARDYQQVMLRWLDDQIIGGDGTTEPEGILTASGTTTVNATNGSGGPWTVGDEEALLFGVTKAYKGGTDPSRIGFGALETTYRRIRGIAVGTTDQRRVFGMDHENYRLFDRFFGIGSSGTGGFTSNRQQIFGNFARYRMYRRLGMTIRTVTDGATLARSNTMLLIPRSRWGGNLEDGAAFAVCADGQS